MWILSYLGPPDLITVDQGSSYVSKEMRSKCEASGIRLLEAPIENPGSIGMVERYHAPLRASFNKIKEDIGADITDKQALEMDVYTINATIGPEGLCPSLLVYGAIPLPARTRPSPTQLKRA